MQVCCKGLVKPSRIEFTEAIKSTSGGPPSDISDRLVSYVIQKRLKNLLSRLMDGRIDLSVL